MPDHDAATQVPPATAGLGSRALRNTVIVLAAKVVARLIALVTVLYIINYLPADHYGSFTTLVNFSAIVSVFLFCAGVGQAVEVQASAHGRPVPAVLEDGGVVRLVQPQRRVAPGQSVVLSTPREVGVAPYAVKISRRGDQVLVQEAAITN